MTAQTPAVLKTYFETGDKPTQTQYADLIDSFVPTTGGGNTTVSGSLLVTGSCAVSGPVEFFSTLTVHNNVAVSGNISLDSGNIALTGATGNASFSGTITAQALSISGTTVFTNPVTFDNAVSAASGITTTSLTVVGGGVVDCATLNASTKVSAAAGNFAGAVSAASLNVAGNVSAAQGTVYASAVRTSFEYFPVATISAAGTTQATGSLCSASICTLKGVVDGSTTGFRLMANRTGLTQRLYSDSVSANLWPPTGGTINALAANAAFPLAASTLYTVVYLAASAYAVK